MKVFICLDCFPNDRSSTWIFYGEYQRDESSFCSLNEMKLAFQWTSLVLKRKRQNRNLEVVRHCTASDSHKGIFFIEQETIVDASVKALCSLCWAERNRIEASQHCKVISTTIRVGDLEQWNSKGRHTLLPGKGRKLVQWLACNSTWLEYENNFG